MGRPFSWLHLSDIHFLPKNAWSDSVARQSLLDELKRSFDDRTLPNVDAIFCTGDIAFGALTTSPLHEQYAMARDFFDELLGICLLSSDRLFVVPGNHDIDRAKIDRAAQDSFVQYAQSSSPKHEASMNAAFIRKDETAAHAFRRLDAYLAFVESYLPHCLGSNRNANFAQVLAHDHLSVAVCGLNSAWTCQGGDEDQTCIWLAAKAQFNALRPAIGSAAVKIALMHHPIDWLTDADKKFSERRLSSEYDFFLHGHTHDAWINAGHKLVTIRAGATSAETDPEFGFNIVSLDTAAGLLKAHVRTYLEAENVWRPAVTHDQKSAGYHEYPLNSRIANAVTKAKASNASTSLALPIASTDMSILSGADLQSVLATPGSELQPRPACLATIGCEKEKGRRRLVQAIEEGAPFHGLVRTSEGNLERPVTWVANWCMQEAEPGARLTIRGPRGAGRLQFLATLYVYLRHKGEVCLFVDLDSPCVSAALVEEAVAACKDVEDRVVGLVYESNSDRRSPEWWKILRKLTSARIVVVSGREEPDLEVGADPEDLHHSSTSYVELINLLEGTGPAKSRLGVVSEALEAACKNHRLNPDFYTAKLFYRHAPGDVALARLMQQQLRTRVEQLTRDWPAGGMTPESGAPAILQEQLATSRLIKVASYAHARDTLGPDEAGQKTPRAIVDLYSHLCSQSEHVAWLLIAWGDVHKLHACCSPSMSSDASAKASPFDPVALDELDHVYVSAVNVFAKEIINTWPEYSGRSLNDGLLQLLRNKDAVPRHLNLRSNVCYLLGRIESRQPHEEISNALHRTIQQVDRFRHTVKLATSIVAQMGRVDESSRQKLATFLQDFGIVSDASGTISADEAHACLAKLDRQCLLLVRSAYISLAMLDDRRAAAAYLDRLASSPRENDLNRGFHLEYFQDMEFKRSEPLLSTDRYLGQCTRTVKALSNALGSGSDTHAMNAIQAFTLASLLRSRTSPHFMHDGLPFSVPEDTKAQALSAIKRFLGEPGRRPREVDGIAREAIEQYVREIEWGDWALEAMVDDIYTLKFQRRAGWGDIGLQESVAAHSMFVQLLAHVFGDDQEEADEETAGLPPSFPLLHDLGESVTSDIPIHQKNEQSNREERSVVLAISLMGLSNQVEPFARLVKHFDLFESTKNRTGAKPDTEENLAMFFNDLDRLDLLIQFYRYVRDGEPILNEDGFRNHVQPREFATTKGRRLASRFTSYFESEAAARRDRTMWPIEPKQNLVGRSVV